jgi:hypothetical protein
MAFSICSTAAEKSANAKKGGILMLRKLLISTAVSVILTGGAYAQTATPEPLADPVNPAATEAVQVPMVKRAEGHLASHIIGETVYNGTGDGAESIGDINDLILSPEGQIEAVVIGVGGFLGIGEKDVAIEFALVEIAEVDGWERLVVDTTADALEAQESFDSAAYRPARADANVKETKPATAEDLAKAPKAEDPDTTAEESASSQTQPSNETTSSVEKPAAGSEVEKPETETTE